MQASQSVQSGRASMNLRQGSPSSRAGGQGTPVSAKADGLAGGIGCGVVRGVVAVSEELAEQPEAKELRAKHYHQDREHEQGSRANLMVEHNPLERQHQTDDDTDQGREQTRQSEQVHRPLAVF